MGSSWSASSSKKDPDVFDFPQISATDGVNNILPFFNRVHQAGIPKDVYLSALHLATRYALFGLKGTRAGSSVAIGGWENIRRCGTSPEHDAFRQTPTESQNSQNHGINILTNCKPIFARMNDDGMIVLNTDGRACSVEFKVDLPERERSIDGGMRTISSRRNRLLSERGSCLVIKISQDTNGDIDVYFCGDMETVSTEQVLEHHSFTGAAMAQTNQSHQDSLTPRVVALTPYGEGTVDQPQAAGAQWYLQFLPDNFNPKVAMRALEIGVKWNKYEHHFTGMLMIIALMEEITGGKNSNRFILQPDFNEMIAKKELNIFNEEQSADFKKLFLEDGAIIVHPQNGKVLAVTCKLYPRPDCEYQHAGHGTKHNSAAETTWDVPSVAVARSDAGGVSMYTSKMTRRGFCAEIEDYRGGATIAGATTAGATIVGAPTAGAGQQHFQRWLKIA